jgi:hypothetical protein
MIFSIIVFGCISSSAWDDTRCYFGTGENGDPVACGYGTAVGVLAFIQLMIFIALDALFDNLSNAIQRKYIVIGDIVSSGVMSFLWFVCFCYLANSWRISTPPMTGGYWRGTSGIEAAIAFSFFSTASFTVITVLAVLRYRQGVTADLSPQYNADPFGGFDSHPVSQTPAR